MITIDGSVLEGGGQILRNTVSLSALLRTPVRIHSIRNGRKVPGLKNQHRTGLELTSRISKNSVLSGAANKSQEITFEPGEIDLPDQFEADTVTAGACTLLLQIALPLLLFSRGTEPTAPSTLTLKGGTNAELAPQIDYAQRIFLPFVKRHFGVNPATNIEIQKRGYYPKGGGQILATIHPNAGDGKLRPITLLDRGEVTAIRGIAHFAGLPNVVGQGMAKGALKTLSGARFRANQMPIEIEEKREENFNTVGAGSGMVLWAELAGGGVLGGSAVGRKGMEPYKVGELAANELLKAIDAEGCVDEWLQDQIILFMALADGFSQVRCGKGDLTLHTQTAIHVATQLTSAQFNVIKETDGRNVICCEGIGYTRTA